MGVIAFNRAVMGPGQGHCSHPPRLARRLILTSGYVFLSLPLPHHAPDLNFGDPPVYIVLQVLAQESIASRRVDVLWVSLELYNAYAPLT